MKKRTLETLVCSATHLMSPMDATPGGGSQFPLDGDALAFQAMVIIYGKTPKAQPTKFVK